MKEPDGDLARLGPPPRIKLSISSRVKHSPVEASDQNENFITSVWYRSIWDLLKLPSFISSGLLGSKQNFRTQRSFRLAPPPSSHPDSSVSSYPANWDCNQPFLKGCLQIVAYHSTFLSQDQKKNNTLRPLTKPQTLKNIFKLCHCNFSSTVIADSTLSVKVFILAHFILIQKGE